MSKTLVNGTAYDIKGGRCLVNGTGYSIKKGRTLVNGTGYDINFGTPVSSLPVGTTIYLNYNGYYEPFTVVHNGIHNNQNAVWCASDNLLPFYGANYAGWNVVGEFPLGLIVDSETYPELEVFEQLQEATKKFGEKAQSSMITIQKYYQGDDYSETSGISGTYTKKVHFMTEEELGIMGNDGEGTFDYYSTKKAGGDNSIIASRRKKRVTPNFNKNMPFGNYALTTISERGIECSGEVEVEDCDEYICWGYIGEDGYDHYKYDYFTSNIPYCYMQINVALTTYATVDENMRILEST